MPSKPAKKTTGTNDELAKMLGQLQPPSRQGDAPASPRAAPASLDSPPTASQALPGDPEEYDDLPGPTVGDAGIANLPPDDPVLPGFAMADDIEDLPDPVASSAAAGVAGDAQRELTERSLVREAAAPLSGEILPPGNEPLGGGAAELAQRGEIRYESRIRVLEAFQYRGNLANAPEWVDRNWAAYGDWDPLRNIPAGPALRVPTQSGETVLARPGDYVVRQAVTIEGRLQPIVQTEVWAKDNFERLFVPEEA